jgi:hypothetical protein
MKRRIARDAVKRLNAKRATSAIANAALSS